ncbi:hypothetical protein E0H75_42180 [Kribbella capetownensis]|uniref:Uncharacterized protein n=1 Tax=Kribbella capetownensis TaxID=1572659 RepID=A0A4R0IN72_9ACTN|nr:hypothetical protein [Kribbella capetownensis]TCC33870.1 hypothetical protein E0H75_42180 [Kribbella capetownensis]
MSGLGQRPYGRPQGLPVAALRHAGSGVLAHAGVVAEWHCGKCEGAAVPEHHRLCPKRDPRLRIKRIVVVVWPPFVREDGGSDSTR